MIFAWGFKVEFKYGKRAYRCQVDKMRITDHRPEKFYRISAQTGTRDLIKHEGQWIVVSGKPLPFDLLDELGAAIEDALKDKFDIF